MYVLIIRDVIVIVAGDLLVRYTRWQRNKQKIENLKIELGRIRAKGWVLLFVQSGAELNCVVHSLLFFFYFFGFLLKNLPKPEVSRKVSSEPLSETNKQFKN